MLTLVKGQQLVLLHPLQLKSVDFRSRSTLQLHLLKGLSQRLRLLRHTEDELVVADVNVVAQKLSTLRVGSSDEQVLRAHEIPLESGADESVDVFCHWDEDLASKVTALLSAVELVFKVDSSSTVLSKELGQLQDSRQTTVSKSFVSNGPS